MNSINFDKDLQTDTKWEFKDTNQTTIKKDVGIGNTEPDYHLDIDNGGVVDVSIDEEKAEKLEELRETQSEKLERLRDHIINYLADNDVCRSDVEQWKRDLEKIDKHRDQLEKSSGSHFITFPDTFNENNILGPEDLEKLNDIYDRWS